MNSVYQKNKQDEITFEYQKNLKIEFALDNYPNLTIFEREGIAPSSLDSKPNILLIRQPLRNSNNF